ncbi:hypothetical protein [Spongiactinospora sp. TRM90649]|uniref:hypothetical protein n=1 Tax=Spongiactinospora sp. TRM90649 TaxID=3031114 RepID=UPI0023F88649|nr:hypothetical protein [Spongiactinospora sp. TRM90649]MDF5754727.1 hypothetical protein [Spongiactinospora sp. TRM90649]
MIGQDTEKGDAGAGERAVVTRRGSAFVVYKVHTTYDNRRAVTFKNGDFRRQSKDATAMARKVCDISGVCDR